MGWQNICYLRISPPPNFKPVSNLCAAFSIVLLSKLEPGTVDCDNVRMGWVYPGNKSLWAVLDVMDALLKPNETLAFQESGKRNKKP